MIRSRNYLEIAGGIVQYIAVYVVYVLISGQFAAKESFHNKTVLRLITTITRMNIPIAIFNIFTREDTLAYRLAMPFIQSVVRLAQALCMRWGTTTIHATYRGLSIVLLCNHRVAVLAPSSVVGAAISTPNTRRFTAFDSTECFRFWHRLSIT